MTDHGVYKTDENGRSILIELTPDEELEEYVIAEGTDACKEDVFKEVPHLRKITIPASLKEIPDGAFSNGGGWASEEKGICEISLSPNNPYFTICERRLFCKKETDGSLHLIRVLSGPETLAIPSSVGSIGRDAFRGLSVSCVTFEKNDQKIWFPIGHLYYLERLLSGFGKNGKLYDFNEYDRFLLGDHFNPERIRMLAARIEDPRGGEEGIKERLISNTRDHMEELTEALIKDGDEELLKLLAASGIFTAENIGYVFDSVNRSERKDLMFWLIEYKNSVFPREEEEDEFAI